MVGGLGQLLDGPAELSSRPDRTRKGEPQQDCRRNRRVENHLSNGRERQLGWTVQDHTPTRFGDRTDAPEHSHSLTVHVELVLQRHIERRTDEILNQTRLPDSLLRLLGGGSRPQQLPVLADEKHRHVALRFTLKKILHLPQASNSLNIKKWSPRAVVDRNCQHGHRIARFSQHVELVAWIPSFPRTRELVVHCPEQLGG